MRTRADTQPCELLCHGAVEWEEWKGKERRDTGRHDLTSDEELLFVVRTRQGKASVRPWLASWLGGVVERRKMDILCLSRVFICDRAFRQRKLLETFERPHSDVGGFVT